MSVPSTIGKRKKKTPADKKKAPSRPGTTAPWPGLLLQPSRPFDFQPAWRSIHCARLKERGRGERKHYLEKKKRGKPGWYILVLFTYRLSYLLVSVFLVSRVLFGTVPGTIVSGSLNCQLPMRETKKPTSTYI